MSSGGPLRLDQGCYDVQHYRLILKVDPKQREISGELTMRALMLSDSKHLALHLDSLLKVSGVSLLSREAQWKHRDGIIRITAKSSFKRGSVVEVRVHYRGHPRIAKAPPWQGGFTWSKTKSGAPWIATSCQGQGADLWWPCKDHPSDKPSSMDLVISVPKGLTCASNGTLKKQETKGDWTIFHWHIANPISNYGVALNIAPYKRLDAKMRSLDGTTFPVYFWVLPEDEKKGRAILPQFIRHLHFFEKTIGPYPFRNEKYGVVQTPHLGMEHQTIIAYGNRFNGLRGDYDWLHHHELSHEWWGNLVTCRDWKDMWIHEGFGTYMQALYLEEFRGPEAYRAELAKNRSRVSNRKPVAPRISQGGQQIYFAGNYDNDVYFKGAWVLHALRWLIGDAALRESFRRFCYPTLESVRAKDGSQVRFVSTEDYTKLVSQIARRNLDWFFEIYLRQAKLPELIVEDSHDGFLHLRWKTPKDLPFPMPVPLRVGDDLRRIQVPKQGTKVRIPKGRPYELDPDIFLFRKHFRRRRLR